MSITSFAIWEMRPTNGADTNGGFYKEGASGTDYSQQNSPQYSLTGLTTSGASATILYSGSSTDMVGNGFQLTGGTNGTTAIYEIVSVVAGVSFTCDRNVSTGSLASGTGNIGGALKTFSKLIGSMVSGSRAWVKAESTITSASNISINFTSSLPCWIAGYTTTRGDGLAPTIQAITNTGFNLVSVDNNNGIFQFIFRNFILDCNSKSSVNGFRPAANGASGENLKVINLNGGSAFQYGNVQGGTLRNCLVSSPSGGVGFDWNSISNGTIAGIDCWVLNGSSTTAFQMAGMGFFLRCVAGNGTGSSSDAFHIGGQQGFLHFQNCIAYKWGQDGFSFNNASNNYTFSFMNNISYGNGRYGVNNLNAATTALTTGSAMNDYNAVGGNTTANYNGISAGTHSATLTGDPFNGGGTNDFTLNNTAGAGALCRALGFPGTILQGGIGYLDIGALQHQDSGGSSGPPVMAVRQIRYIKESR